LWAATGQPVRYSRIIAACCGAAVLAGAFAMSAAAEVHGYLTASTDYVYRGISQSNEDPSVQAGLDYAHAGGFFAGLFAASIDYPETTFVADPGDIELDAYVGFGRPAGRDFAWDVALIHYYFPDTEADDDEYQELGFNLHYRDVARLGLTASDDARRRGATAWTAEVELRQPLGERFQVSGTLGHYSFGSSAWSDYQYWDVGVSLTAGPVTFDLRYYDTSTPAETVAGPNLTAARVVASASVGF
jgi:uncharacterized protein (TIGR02001 family)